MNCQAGMYVVQSILWYRNNNKIFFEKHGHAFGENCYKKSVLQWAALVVFKDRFLHRNLSSLPRVDKKPTILLVDYTSSDVQKFWSQK
jgi:hypothetical protein